MGSSWRFLVVYGALRALEEKAVDCDLAWQRPRQPPDISTIAAVPLHHLDLVAVWVLNKKEAGEQRPVMLEIDDVARCEAERFEAGMLSLEVVDHEGDMAVAVPELVRDLPVLVNGQFNLEIG